MGALSVAVAAADNFGRVQSAMARSAVVVFLVGLTIARVAGQATDFALQKFGLSVSDAEIAQIADLVSSTGKRPWLLRSPHTGEMDVRIAYLFLEPDQVGARVHRGQVLMLGADGPRFGPPRSPWRIRETRSYAYIPMQGRQPGDIRNESDTDWPFTVHGEFDDDTLISLIEFIRSGPRLPMVREGQLFRQLRSAPVSFVARRNESILVDLRTGDLQGERITVARQNSEWVITDFGMWIV